jgi:hypothetical protein
LSDTASSNLITLKIFETLPEEQTPEENGLARSRNTYALQKYRWTLWNDQHREPPESTEYSMAVTD